MNQLLPESQQDTRPRVPLSSLKVGDKHTHDKHVHTVFKCTEHSITIRRHDDWLCTINKGDYGWDKMVVKK